MWAVEADIGQYSEDALTSYPTIPTFNDPEKVSFDNIVRKGENAGYQHFSFSYNVFYLNKTRDHYFSNILFVVCK